MNIKIVVGANYGDEGKGLATDYFTRNAKGPVLNVLYNGGPQRGHTVEHKNGLRHIFHHYGSGFFSGAQTYFDKYFLIDPTKFNIEHCNLIDQAKHFTDWSIVDIVDKTICYAHPECRVITPWDVIAGQVTSKGHSSCGAGVWQTIVRYIMTKGNSRTIGNLYDISEEARRRYFISIRDWWKDYYDLTAEKLGDYADIYYSDGLLEHYLKDFNTMCRSKIVIATMEELLTEKTYDTIIFEGGQGLGLGNNTSYFEKPNCFTDGLTPSDTSSYHPIKWLKENSKLIDISKDQIEIAYVTRTYFTRHGDGPLPNECSKEDLGINYIDITNQSNQFQGDLRYAPFNDFDFRKRVFRDYCNASDVLKTNDIQKSIFLTHVQDNFYPNTFPIEDFHKIYISKSPYSEDVKSDCE